MVRDAPTGPREARPDDELHRAPHREATFRMDQTMLLQCRTCGPATDHGSAPPRAGKAKRWRTIDIHCHCMVPEANAMVLKATGIPGGGVTPNANAHVNDLTKSIQPLRGK